MGWHGIIGILKPPLLALLTLRPLFAWSADLRDCIGSVSPGWSAIFSLIEKPLEPDVLLVIWGRAESAAYWLLFLTLYLNSWSDRAKTTLIFSFFLVFKSYSIKLAPLTLFCALTFFLGVKPSGGLFIFMISSASLLWANARRWRKLNARVSASSDSVPIELSYYSPFAAFSTLA